MISNLINMNVPKEPIKIQPVENSNYTIKDYARAFINGMGETQKLRFKQMLDNNIQCGMSVADNYGIDYDKFITEVKNELNKEVK